MLFCRHKSALIIPDRPPSSRSHRLSNNSACLHSEVKCAHSAGAQSCATAIFHTVGMIYCLRHRDLRSPVSPNVGRLREWPPTHFPMAPALATPNSVKPSHLETRRQGLSDVFRATSNDEKCSFIPKRSIRQGEQPFPLISQLVESGDRDQKMKKESLMSPLPARMSSEGGIKVF